MASPTEILIGLFLFPMALGLQVFATRYGFHNAPKNEAQITAWRVAILIILIELVLLAFHPKICLDLLGLFR